MFFGWHNILHISVFSVNLHKGKNVQGCSFRRNRKLEQDKSFSFDNKKENNSVPLHARKNLADHFGFCHNVVRTVYIVKDRELNALYKYVSQDVIVITGFLFFLLQNIPQKREKKRKGINNLEHISALLPYFVQASIFHFG